MTKIIWDKSGERFYETGVKQGVLYPQVSGAYPLGVAWNGLISVTESPSGAEPNPKYADDIKYLNLMSAEEFAATIEAYTYPSEFAACDGSAALATGVMINQQNRSAFGLAYKTTIGNDVNDSLGYKLHLVYGAMASPSEKGYQSINDSPDGVTFSWGVTSTPVEVTGKKPTASIVIDSTKADPTNLATLEGILFGTAVLTPRLPLPDEIATIFTGSTIAAIALSSIVPADGAASISKTAPIVLTFNNKIASEAIIVTDATGVIVAGTKTLDGTGKILTFTPTSALTGTKVYLVTIGGVIDIYGQLLAAAVKDFTTMA